MTASAAVARAALGALERMANKRDENGGPTPLALALLAVLCIFLLVVGSVFYVATQPLNLEGPIGEFQYQVARLFPQKHSGGMTETELTALTVGIADERRKAVVTAALSLVGKVPYFWGGKPSGPGWDENWGTLRQVTAGGVDSSGSYRPYGLDCGGFVRWAYWTGLGAAPAEQGSSTLWWVSNPITEAELLPGDLVFKNVPSEEIGHVGIYLGKNAQGKKLYIHCAGNGGVVLNDWAGFIYYRRLPLIEKTELEG
ncbi:MAG: NlpC/P60 family protein [Oscillospiraceae bacterium]